VRTLWATQRNLLIAREALDILQPSKPIALSASTAQLLDEVLSSVEENVERNPNNEADQVTEHADLLL
jgi:hypothetical protein